MIQFSKPRRSLNAAMDQFRRHEVSARDLLGGGVSMSNEGMINFFFAI